MKDKEGRRVWNHKRGREGRLGRGAPHNQAAQPEEVFKGKREATAKTACERSPVLRRNGLALVPGCASQWLGAAWGQRGLGVNTGSQREDVAARNCQLATHLEALSRERAE